MRVHVIAIGGRIMHNLAILLQQQGNVVSGSDDEIYEPSRSKLASLGLLPDTQGWDTTKITKEIDLIVLGMHAKSDNPELLKSQELGLEIVSYPELIYRHARNKKRVVVGGSHGKTTTTSMIMHVLKDRNIDFDYLVGAELNGFSSMVKLSDADLIIIEGDEYLSSAIDSKPKMLHYFPHLAVITGVAWDHMNVFPTAENYRLQFDAFLKSMDADCKCFFDLNDSELMQLCLNDYVVERISYDALPVNKKNEIEYDDKLFQISVFGKHNLLNLSAAMKICKELDITETHFLESIKTFKGASKRLELIHQSDKLTVYRDFAHAPSKVKATVEAVVQNHKHKRVYAILELHTYSSLNMDFLPQYCCSINAPNKALVYYDHHTLKMKSMPELDVDFIKRSFERDDLLVINHVETLEEEIEEFMSDCDILLIMSSGNLSQFKIQDWFY